MSLKCLSKTFLDVLILVLVEDGLRELFQMMIEPKNGKVLILVLVEDGLREATSMLQRHIWDSLNPCFSGGWSQS